MSTEKKQKDEYAERQEKERRASVDTAASFLSQSHREYLLNRHGTLELDPIPTMSDADPYNWPGWKVCVLGTEMLRTAGNGYRGC